MSVKQGPNRIDAYQFHGDWREQREIVLGGKKLWVPARPIGWSSIKKRLSMAWDVFRGRADALYWRGQ